ncbi:MAG: hypothetical protein Kow0019_08950 [Methanobacteriaceae archaeon]
MNQAIHGKSWTKKDRKDVLNYVKDKLHLYLYSEALPRIEYPLIELMDLSETDFEYLKMVHFLLSPEVKNLIEELPKLLRNLSHSTQKETIECKGIIRGRIDWGLTFKERYTRGFNDPSLFICKPASKMYDLPENQLLKYMLWRIRILTENIDIKIPEELYEVDTFNNWIELILYRYIKIKDAFKHVYFQSINMPRVITPKIIQRTNNHRNKSYQTVIKCHDLYEKLFNVKNEDVLLKLIEKQILEPLNNDKLYEIYVLFKILDYFEGLEGDLEMGLIKPGLDYMARYMSENINVTIYHQQMPPIFSQHSKNKEIFEFYDLYVGLRRPDIILEIETTEKNLYIIIEVKRTQERGYIVDSVYKVLGYLSDFEDCLNLDENPQGLLVVWDGINILNWNKAFQNPVVILKHDNFTKGLDKLINILNNRIVQNI